MCDDLMALAHDAIAHSDASRDPDYPLIHVAPPVGRLNDPNGLIVDDGVYHAFFQFGPLFPHRKAIYWGHAASIDGVHWHDLGPAIAPDSAYDRNGVYSGCGLILESPRPDHEDGAWRSGDLSVGDSGSEHAGYAFFYTGNVKDGGTGARLATQCLVTSPDLTSFAKYPGNPIVPDRAPGYTAHYRDPQVWRDSDGSYRMVVGAQRDNLTGTAVFYRSADLLTWQFEGEMTFPDAGNTFDAFGYMWECPNIVRVTDEHTGEPRDLFIFCPQGIASEREGLENIFPCIALVGRLEGNEFRETTGTFQELDRGFEFYAPQIFARRSEDTARPLFLGWAGNASEDDQPSLHSFGWVHVLTAPRELSVRDGRILQRLASETVHVLERFTAVPQITPGTEIHELSGSRSFRLAVESEHDGWGVRIGTDESHVDVVLCGGTLIVDRSTTRYPHGNRRTVTLPPGTAHRLEILHDRSVTEIFVGDGDIAFTMRSYVDTEVGITRLFRTALAESIEDSGTVAAREDAVTIRGTVERFDAGA